jgi:phosphatidylethanolamine/phosphatidyl-N-methylethanolamine N-methyltransferase
MDRLVSPNAGTAPCARAYERVAAVYDVLDAPYEFLWKRKLRAAVFSRVKDRVLDVGVGTGCNMPFYPHGSSVLGIDHSAAMLARAGARARRLSLSVDLLQCDALATGLPSAAFDAAVATFVFCCIPPAHQLPALRELRRVVRPEGAILILDYTLARRPGLRIFMRAMSPWLALMFSARYDNHPEPRFAEAGLAAVERREFMGGSVVLHTLRRI